jgi:hypothetical protein
MEEKEKNKEFSLDEKNSPKLYSVDNWRPDTDTVSSGLNQIQS